MYVCILTCWLRLPIAWLVNKVHYVVGVGIACGAILMQLCKHIQQIHGTEKCQGSLWWREPDFFEDDACMAILVYTHSYKHAHTFIHTCTHIHTYMHTHSYIHAHTFIHQRNAKIAFGGVSLISLKMTLSLQLHGCTGSNMWTLLQGSNKVCWLCYHHKIAAILAAFSPVVDTWYTHIEMFVTLSDALNHFQQVQPQRAQGSWIPPHQSPYQVTSVCTSDTAQPCLWYQKQCLSIEYWRIASTNNMFATPWHVHIV